MPSQFRFFSSGPSSDVPKNDAETVTPPPVGVSTIPTYQQIQPQQPPMSAEEADDSASSPSGLHEVVKKTDYWFNFQISQLEKYAVEMAVAWANAGIPRQDAPLDGELPIETTLKARAQETFRDWVSRVKRKVQDSIQSSCNDAGEGIVQFRHGLTQLERAAVEIETTETSIHDREDALLKQQKTFGAEALFKHKWLYVPLLLFVALIEWIANVPIFSELLPEEPGTRQMWRKLVADSQQFGAMGGIHRLGEKIALYPDVTVFAFGVIIFLLVLAHFGGEACRAWVVFDPKDEPLLAPTLEARRRQAKYLIFACFVGIFLAMSFLAASRAMLDTAAKEGNAQAQAEVQRLEGELQQFNASGKQLTDVQHQLDLQQQLDGARLRAKDWSERAHFARDIGMMNLPILALNIVLVITALTASYCVAAPKVIEGRLIDPLIPELKQKLSSLRMEIVSHRQTFRTLDSVVQTAISRCKYLASTRPLAEWEAKAKRLNAVVTLFRAENARARGVDPESIIAFRQPCTIDLPLVPDEPFQLPPELSALEDEFTVLRKDFQRLTGGRTQSLAAGAEA